ncbi:MAG: efflux RND transporter permease subunit, partial [Gammaproteobacteria bacterium]
MGIASGARHLVFTTNYRVFFSADNPQLIAFEALENTYQRNDNVLMVLAPKDGKVVSAPALDAVEWLTEQAWQMPYSNRVDSISNFQHTQAEEDDLVVRDLVQGGAQMEDEALSQVDQVARSEPLLVRRLISDEAHTAGVNVTVQLPRVDETKEVPEVVSFARELSQKFSQRYPDIDIRLTGMVMMNNAFSESSQGDMKSLVPVAFAMMLLTLLVLLRNASGTFGTLMVIVLSILVAMGLGGYIGMPLTPPSAQAPVIILTMAIANCVHVLVTFLHQYAESRDRRVALEESLRVNLQPVFLASATTTLGFLSMNFSEVPPFNHLGNLVAMGVVASFILAVTFLPALMMVLPIRPPRQRPAGRVTAMEHLAEFVVRRRGVLLWSMLAITIALVASIPRNELNDVFVNYFDETVDFRSASDFTTENLTGIYQIEYSMESGEPGGISEPAFLDEVASFAAWYREQPETIHVNVLTDIMQRLNKNMHGDDASYYRLPESRELAAQYLLLYEMSLPYGLDLNNQLDVDKAATRMTVTTQTLSSNELLALERRSAEWLAANAPSIETSGSGTSVMFANIGKRNIKSMLVGTTVALVMISGLLCLALRSLKLGLVSMVPNLVPAGMAFGLWALFVGEVGLSLSVVTGMTLGIVVDDTVHFLSKYLRARREQGMSPADAVRYAFRTVGTALVVTSIVLMAGFLVLSMSTF